MNEQALQDAYTLFQQEGYNNSFDEFVNLINSNDQALQDVYNLFTQTGYNKSFDEFNTLMGVKKKDDTSELVSPSETVSTEPTSPTALPQQDVPGDSDSQVTEPDFAELAKDLETDVETQPSYMEAPGAKPEKAEQEAIDQLAEQQGWSKMPTAPQDLEEYFSKITSIQQDAPDSMFEGIIAGGLLEMPELEKEKLSRIAEGESYFLDQEKANAALQYDEEYRAKAADAAKGLVLIEDDVTDVFLSANLNDEEININALRDLKEQYTQQLPEKRRATVESMDLEDFVQYTAETRMRRQFAEAFMGMSGLSDMDLQVKVGKMRGDIDAVQSFKEDGSWAAKKWSNSWDSKMGEWGSGGKFARAKASVELLEDDLKDIDAVLGIYGRAPSEDELIQIGRMVYKGDTSDLAGDLNDEISTRQMPLSGPNSDAGRKALIEQGRKAFKLNRDWWESKKKELEELRDKKQKVGEYYARDFAEIQAFRDVTSKLIDQKVMSEEELNKGAIESLFEGDYELFGYKTLGLIFDIAPDMAKGIGAATVGSLVAGPTGGRVAMSLAFGLQTEDQTAGEYASRPEVTGIEAVEMAKKEGAIEAGISFLFAGLQTKQAAIVTKASEEVAEVFAKGGSRESLRAAREAVQAFAKTEAGIKILDVLGEGTEEALITGLSQYTRAVNEVGQGRMTAEEATAEYRNLYEIGDSFYAGVLGGGATSIPFVLSRGTSAIGSKFTMFDRIKIQTEMEEIRNKLSDPNTTAEEKKELNARFTKLHDDANRLSRKDIEFYQNMTEEDQNRLVELNQRISNVRRTSRQAVTSLAALRNRIRRAESPEQKRAMEAELNQLTSAEAQRRKAAEADIRTLMQEKLEIENKYGSTDSGFDADVEKEQRNRAEIERMVNEVLNVDKGFEGLFSALGVKGIKKGSIRLTAENVDVVLQRILDGNIRGTRFATAEQIKEGIKSALSMAKAVIADNPDAEVLIVDSLTQWKKETRDANNPDGYSVSLGIHIPSDGGKIVLYAPALKANTAYHEGFHQMVFRMMQKSGVDRSSAMIRLASVIRKGMSPELLEKYGSFVGMYKDPNDPFNDALLAEEFLAEVFGDLAEGTIDIKFQKGIVSSFLQFLNQALKERNIRVTGTPLTQDIAVAIKDAANAFRTGEGGAQENILLAFDAADNIVLTPGLEALRAKLEVRRQTKAKARAAKDQDPDEKFITKRKPGDSVKAQKMERQWLASNTPKLVNAGILMHGTSAEFTEFSMRKATESTGMYGKGVYMTHNVDKALSYGGNFVFVDGERLNLANLQRKDVAEKFLNSVLSKETEGGLGLAAIAAGKAKRPVGLVGKYDLFSLEYQALLMYSGLDLEFIQGTNELRPRYDFERLYDPVEFVESIYEEMYKLAEGVNIPMSSAEQLSSFGLNGIRSHMTGRSMGMVPGLGGFVRNVFRTYNNRLSERRIDPKDFENDELKYDVAMALTEGAYMTQVIRAGYDGVYVSREFDYGGSMENLNDDRFEKSGVEGGLAQEAIIFNNTLLNQSIIEFEDVIPLADSRIAQGRTRTEKGGELGTDLMLNDRMRALGAVKRQGPALNEYMDNYDSEVADFVDSESIPVKVRSEQDLSRMESIMLDVLEFFYDKFYKALRIQREIQKGRGGRRVMREQDYEMALALIDGKASGRLQSVDKFMEQLAGVMNKYGILHDQLGQFLYAMHAPNRNAVIAERMANSLNTIKSEIEELQEQIKKEEDVEEKGKLQKKLKDKRDKAQEIEARMEGGNFSGMTDQEAAELVEALDSEGMREAYDMVMDFQKETRRLIVEYGLETQKTIDMLEAVYPSYVPLSGFAVDEDANEVGYANMHQARVFRGIRRAEGRKSEARNPLDHIFERRYQTVLAGEKNVANTRLLNLLAANPEPSMYRIFGPKDKLPGVVGRKTPMTEAEARRDERFVEVVVNGESFFIRFESEAVARAVNKHNITRLGDGVHKYVQKTFQMIRSFGRFMSMSFTSWSPDFVGQNFIRDLQFGLGSLLAEQEIAGGQAYGEKIVKDAAKGVYPALKFLGKTIVGGVEDTSDPLYRYYKEFSERGATTDWPYQKNADQFRSDIETLTNAQNPNLKTKATTLLKATGRLVDGVNKSVENAVRFAAFVAARKAGVDAEAAAYLAKELTINFNRSGSGGSVVNAIYLFFNAGVQGTAKFVRTMGTLKKVPDGRGGYYKTLNSAQMVAAGMSGFAFLMAFVNEAMSGEDEDGRSHYEKIPDYVKERNMIFMNPFDEEGKDHFAIPLPYGYNIFHNAGTVGAEAAMGIRSAGSAGMFLTGGMVNSFIPVSFGQSSSVAKKTVKAFTPTFLRPWMEWAINESYFGTPVYNENFPGQNLPASSLASRSPEWLRETAKFLNEATGGNEFEAGWLDADPDVAAYIFQYYTGGTGRFLEKVSKSVDNSISLLAGESDIRAGEIASDLPLFGKLYGTPNARQDVADYYKFRTNVRTKAKAAKELGLDDEKYRNSVVLNEIGVNADRQLKENRRLMRAVQNNEKLDPQVKARDIETLERERMQIIYNFNREYLKYYERRKTD